MEATDPSKWLEEVKVTEDGGIIKRIFIKGED
jgi:hypothetical protein